MSGKLFLSFWDICLSNLPEGNFSHRCITGQEARSLIEQARHNNEFLCVTNHDLLAPYKKRNADNHKKLCTVLSQHFDIALSLREFMTSTEHEGEPLYSATPLQFAQVNRENRLLIVNCNYSMKIEGEGNLPESQVIPESIAFHLIESGHQS